MKILLVFIWSAFFIFHMTNAIANNNAQTESLTQPSKTNKNQLSNFDSSSSYFSINYVLNTHTLTSLSFEDDIKENLLTKIKAQYQYSIIQLETGLLTQETNQQMGQAFYLQGALVIHQDNKFNLSVMANIEHLNEQRLSYYQNNSYNTSEASKAIFNTRYGFVGSYVVTPSWQVTGGVIYSTVHGNLGQGVWNQNDNMALIGTTYSF